MLRYSRPTRELDPVERLLAAVIKAAIRDAQQERDKRLREEAAQWLWDVASGVAEKAPMPPSSKVYLLGHI